VTVRRFRAGLWSPGSVRLGAVTAAFFLVPAMWACQAEPEREGLRVPGEGPAVQEQELPEGVLPPPDPDPVLPDPVPPVALPIPEAPGLRTLSADTVQGWTGPGGRPFEVTLRTPADQSHLQARIGQASFLLPARLTGPTLVQYPCTSCHEGVTVFADRIPDAHRNIQPVHPATTGGTCSTCHVPDAVERLFVPGEPSASMDHAYRLCAQCHSPQVRDWAGGVHGKRLEGWSGRRVVMNCADCHDPHSPGLVSRIPYPGPQLPRRDGRP